MERIRVLVTGGTGFLGRYVLKAFADSVDVTLLSRSSDKGLKGDLTHWDGGIDCASLKGSFDVCLHMAGLYDLRVSESEAIKHNDFGTHTALTIAQKAEIPHFIFTSTVAVTFGDNHKIVNPNDLRTAKCFSDHYAHSKAQAERMVRCWQGGFKSKTILRPGILIGDTGGGPILRIDGPYYVAEAIRHLSPLLRKCIFPLPFPGLPRGRLPVVPVDVCGGAIAKITQKCFHENWRGIRSFHLTPSRGLGHRQIYESAFRYYALNPKRIKIVKSVPKTLYNKLVRAVTHIPQQEIEYMFGLPRLSTFETEELLGSHWCPEFENYEQNFWKGYEKFLSNR
jgi:hypothetical protein